MIPVKGMSESSHSKLLPRTVVVFPTGDSSQLREPALRRWVARGTVHSAATDEEFLNRVLHILGRPAVTQGLGALRLWGHDGERPDGWVAAADPVHLEAMLDHLRLHQLHSDDLDTEQTQALFADIQAALGNNADTTFNCVDGWCYLKANAKFCTARVSAAHADGARPETLMPAGDSAASHDRLLSEIQMTLHASPVNARRQAEGRYPANSLWLWGGGFAGETESVSPFRLFTDDPLFRGYWAGCSGLVSPWQGSIRACLAESFERAVVVLPHSPPEATMQTMLKTINELKGLHNDKRIFPLQLVFRDGVNIRLESRDRFRFWRGNLPALADTE
jgi:hypothetical protein